MAFTSYLFGKKESQLFNQLLEDILIAKLEPWHHLQAYGVLFLMNTRQKREAGGREASTLVLTSVPCTFGSQIALLKKKKKKESDRRKALNSKTIGHLKN